MATGITKDFPHIVKSDLAITQNTTVYSPNYAPKKTNGRQLVKVVYNDANGTLDATKLMTIGIANAVGSNNVYNGNVIRTWYDGAATITFTKGDVMAEFILPPHMEALTALRVYITLVNSAGTIHTKDCQVQVSMIM